MSWETATGIAQTTALPLELLGLLLAFIEVKYPELADRIEARLDRVRIWSEVFFGALFDRIVSLFENHPRRMTVFAIGLVVLPPILFKGVAGQDTLQAIGILLYLSLLIFPALIISPLLFLRALDNWSGGRGVGTFGVLLAFLGFTIEVFQFWVLVYVDQFFSTTGAVA